jgi:TldD protein
VALDAARTSGANYADVRLTHDWNRAISDQNVNDHERMAVGVRALVDGYWGFASSPYWSTDELARLGREATHQATIGGHGKPRIVDLAPVDQIHDGHWDMPVAIDPFTVYPIEVQDYLSALQMSAQNIPGVREASVGVYFFQQEQAFASTGGSYYTQRRFRTSGGYKAEFKRGALAGGASVDQLTPTGAGWELFREQPLQELLRHAIDTEEENLSLPTKPVDVGRYQTLMDAYSVANLMSATIGLASELDRAMGYEANASGTSYLNDPMAMLGTFKLGSPQLTVLANRTEPGGLATTHWDDEGVTPNEYPLISQGILTDFQTTREAAGWIKPYYERTHAPFRSHGCACAASGLEVASLFTGNLVLTPGTASLDNDQLLASIDKGIAFTKLSVYPDFQQGSGLAGGTAYEIKNGKRVARVLGSGLLFKATELWKNLSMLGDSHTARRYGFSSQKGEPPQTNYHSVSAVPSIFKDVTVIDKTRKA